MPPSAVREGQPALAGYGPDRQGHVGRMSIKGDPKGQPTKVGVPVGDIVREVLAAHDHHGNAVEAHGARGSAAYVDVRAHGRDAGDAHVPGRPLATSRRGCRPAAEGNNHPTVVAPLRTSRRGTGTSTWAVERTRAVTAHCARRCRSPSWRATRGSPRTPAGRLARSRWRSRSSGNHHAAHDGAVAGAHGGPGIPAGPILDIATALSDPVSGSIMSMREDCAVKLEKPVAGPDRARWGRRGSWTGLSSRSGGRRRCWASTRRGCCPRWGIGALGNWALGIRIAASGIAPVAFRSASVSQRGNRSVRVVAPCGGLCGMTLDSTRERTAMRTRSMEAWRWAGMDGAGGGGGGGGGFWGGLVSGGGDGGATAVARCKSTWPTKETRKVHQDKPGRHAPLEATNDNGHDVRSCPEGNLLIVKGPGRAGGRARKSRVGMEDGGRPVVGGAESAQRCGWPQPDRRQRPAPL